MIVFSTSCSNNRKADYTTPDLINNSVDTLYYSTFVDSIKYVILETTETCLIKSITDLIITQKNILIFDEGLQKIWIFDLNGAYLSEIAKQGDGPDEYVRIKQFEYDYNRDLIAVLDVWTQSILMYTIEGVFMKKVELETPAFDFKIISQVGFITSQAGLPKSTAGIYQVDSLGKTKAHLVKRNEEHLVRYSFNWDLCSYGDTIVFMSPNFDNFVYHFIDQQLEVAYPFEMYPKVSSKYTENSSLEFLEDFIRTEYIENSKWILATYWSSVYGIRTFIFSKEKQVFWIGKSFINDIDKIEMSEKTSESSNNTFTFWCNHENIDKNPIIQILYMKP